MVRRIIFLLASFVAMRAGATCPVADRLIDQYGISFSGFKKNIPRVISPNENVADAESLVVLRLPNQRGEVPDGFSHAALINKEAKRAWILRKGGFLHVYEWYGPVLLKEIDLAGCVTEPRITQLRSGKVLPEPGAGK